ncbi:MAG: hypothetical protein ACUVTC_07010 [Candidatus Bathycorpusculaceae bacterium]
MHKVEEINENNKQKVVELLCQDVVRHVFAIWDIQHEPANTKMY